MLSKQGRLLLAGNFDSSSFPGPHADTRAPRPCEAVPQPRACLNRPCLHKSPSVLPTVGSQRPSTGEPEGRPTEALRACSAAQAFLNKQVGEGDTRRGVRKAPRLAELALAPHWTR